MAPAPTGTAFCIASPRVRSSRAVSAMVRLPAAASAEYSPSECPATKAASRPTEKPASVSSTRERRDRHRHQRRLGVLGELQGFGRTVPDHGGQLLAERRIDLVEHRAGGRKGFGERLAHADRLGPLPRKSKCCRHRRSLKVPKSLELGGKTLRAMVMSSHRDSFPGFSGGFLRRFQAQFPASFPCHHAENPYKPRHPWVPAGS